MALREGGGARVVFVSTRASLGFTSRPESSALRFDAMIVGNACGGVAAGTPFSFRTERLGFDTEGFDAVA